MANGNIAGAAAYQRLQPRKPLKIGAIVEEHIRYWRKYDDAKDAAKKAREAKEGEALLKQNEKYFELYKGLQPKENKGFFNDQIIGHFEKHKGEYSAIARKAAAGDYNAMQKYADIKNSYENLFIANKNWGEKAAENSIQKNEKGIYNEYLDKSMYDFGQSVIGKGIYSLTDDLIPKLNVYDPSSREVKTVSNSALNSNEYLTHSYSKKPEFEKNGAAIAKQLLDTDDGQKLIKTGKVRNTSERGIELVQSIFAQDAVEGRSWLAAIREQAKKADEPEPFKGKTFYDLNKIEANSLAKSYYEKNALPNISQTTEDTSLEDAQTRANIEKTRLANKKARKAEREASSRITIAKDETGDVVKQRYMNEQKSLKNSYNQVAIENADTYVIGRNGVTFYPVKGSKKTAVTMTNLLVEKDGTTVGIAKRIVQEPVLDNDGVEIPGKFTDKVSDVYIRDKTALGNFATLIDKEDGTPYKDLTELTATLKKLKAGVKSTVDPTKQKTEPKKTEPKKTEPKKTESKEDRLARMRAAIDKGN